MRAAVFHEHGGPDVLAIEEVPDPVPREGDVLVQVHAAAFNHLDLWVRRGLPIETVFPHIGGSDIAGVVTELGAAVTDWQVGDRVLVNPVLSCGRCEWCARGEEPLCPEFRVIGEHLHGGFAELVRVPAANLHRLPEGMEMEEAACLPVSYSTAWRALFTRARLRSGEDVLVLGASGGTATAVIQLALYAGARVFAATSGPGNVERVRALGAEFVYDRLEVDFSPAVYADSGRRGVDVVVENVGQATWKGSVRALTRGGRLVTYGATTGHRADLDLRVLFWKQLEILGSTMSSRAEFQEMLDAVSAAGIRPVIDEVLPLDEAAEAHRRLEAGEAFGKLVLRTAAAIS